MGIEPREHAADGVLEQGLVLDGLDVVVLDLGEDLGERAQVLERQRALTGALSQHALAAGEQRAQDEPGCQDGQRVTPVFHGCLRAQRAQLDG